MGEKVTIPKIAEVCGTSIGTVDRALNNRSGISPATRDRILKTAEEMGYRTNKFAGALSRKKSKSIAVVYPAAPRDFYVCMEKGIEKAARDFSAYGMEFHSYRYGVDGAQDEERVLSELDAEKYDGIAIDPLNENSAKFVDRFTQMGKPVALFNNDLPKSSRLFFVGESAVQSGRIGGDILGLLLRGRGSAAVLGNFVKSMPFLGRYEGFASAVREYYPDIDIRPCADCCHSDSITEDNIRAFLDGSTAPRGIFCTSYSSTLSTIQALEKLKRKDVLLVGYDVSRLTAEAVRSGICKALIYQNPFRQAYLVLELLQKHILEGWQSKKEKILIPTRIAFRQNIDDYADGIIREDIDI
ncbi:MAG: LacI family DNA-binding transcriptional regulator [Candidatus Limivicinus sp.]|jgi:LacI family transcriptional regulator